MYKLTFCSIAFRNEPIEDILPKLAAIGYDGVEVWANHLDGKSDKELESIRKLAETDGIDIEVVSPYLWLTQNEELLDESLQIAERTIHQCRILHAPKFRTFTDSGPTGIGSDVATPAHWEQAVAALKQITAQAPELLFVVETHPKTLADVPSAALELLERVATDNLKILYQPTDAASLIENYETYGPHIRHMHLQNQTADGTHTWLEDGTMNFASFMARLREDGYKHSVSVEYCWQGATWERAESAYKLLRG